MNILNQPVLALNQNWVPIDIYRVKRAISQVFDDKALIIDPESFVPHTFQEWTQRDIDSNQTLKAGPIDLEVPEVITLKDFSDYPSDKTVSFNRANIYKRDNYTCQYCGGTPGTKELSIDHVVPRSRGGKTTWKNCVIACTDCNFEKSDNLPSECGMTLLTEPYEPDWSIKYSLQRKYPPESWQNFIDEVYWYSEFERE